MFGTKKGQNPAALLGLSPEMADDLDRRLPDEAAEPESYDDPPPAPHPTP